MSNPTITGQSLLDELVLHLGGLSNAFTVDQQLLFLNRGIAEVWAVLKSLDLDYFGDSSENSNSSQDEYFATLTQTIREYNLPVNCREVRFMECLSVGFEDRIFEYRKFDDPVFQLARRQSTALGPTGGGQATSATIIGAYYYTVFGNQLVLAQWPEFTGLNVKIWYIASIDQITDPTVPLNQILYPFQQKIVDYATTRALLSARDETLSAEWMQDWKDQVKDLVISAGSRESTNPIFISDYVGS